MVSNSDRALHRSECSAALQAKHLHLHNQLSRRTSCTVKNLFPKVIFTLSSFLYHIPPLITHHCGDIHSLPSPKTQTHLSVALIPILPFIPEQHRLYIPFQAAWMSEFQKALWLVWPPHHPVRTLAGGRHLSQTNTLCYELLNKHILAT